MSHAQAPKKRRWLGPVIVVAVLLLLIIVAFAIAEKLVRDGASAALSEPIRQIFGTETEVHVDFGQGSVILQAMSGSIDAVTVDADTVTLGPSTGRIHVVANGVPLSTDGTVRALAAELYFDAAGVTSLVASSSGALATTQLDGEHIVVTTESPVAGQTVPVVVTLSPSAADGRLGFSVEALAVNGAAVDVDAARSGAYGAEVAALVQGQSVCVAEHLPASLALDSATVVGDRLVLGFVGSNLALAGGGLTTKGACAT